MSSLSPNSADFLPQFKAIGQSLRKRFFRKPNVSDAVEQYETLCQELQREGQNEYAGICSLEAAKCQETLQNHMEHANLLVKSSKFFLDAREPQKWFETDPNSLCSNQISSQGNLQLAVQCLRQAAKVYKVQGKNGLTLLLTLKMGETLYREGEYGESLKLFKDALNVASAHFTLADQLVIVECIVKCKVKMSELESASKTVGEYLGKLSKHGESQDTFPKELFNTFLLRFEVMRVCLLLITGTDSADMAKFIWPESSLPEDSRPDQSPNSERNEALLYLKSLVLAVQHGSVDEINVVRDHLAPILTETEHDLFMVLIKLQA